MSRGLLEVLGVRSPSRAFADAMTRGIDAAVEQMRAAGPSVREAGARLVAESQGLMVWCRSEHRLRAHLDGVEDDQPWPWAWGPPAPSVAGEDW